MTKKEASELVRKNGWALEFVPDELRDEVEAAVEMRRGERGMV
ncbi:MAG: DUF4116 domain-containing protein [Treponema sp.]|jgi:hypothetical protein|nr:DUF4116 domain-containing protein [Treponema sp.]